MQLMHSYLTNPDQATQFSKGEAVVIVEGQDFFLALGESVQGLDQLGADFVVEQELFGIHGLVDEKVESAGMVTIFADRIFEA